MLIAKGYTPAKTRPRSGLFREGNLDYFTPGDEGGGTGGDDGPTIPHPPQPAAPEDPGGGTLAPLGGEEHNEEEYIGKAWSKGFSGVPDWLMGRLQGMSKFLKPMARHYKKSLKDLGKMPQHINRASDQLKKKYTEQLALPTQRAINEAIARATGQGALNSSVLGDVMERNTEAAMRSAEGVHRDTNVWAENQKAQHLLNQLMASGQLSSQLANWMGLSRFSESESRNRNPAALIPYIFNQSG